MKYALVLGHDRKRKGAVGSFGVTEYDFNKEIILELMERPELVNSDNEFMLFKRDSTIRGYTAQMIDLHKRIDAWGADCSISLHFNDAVNKSANGYEVLYYSNGGKTFASRLDNLFDMYLKTNDRGIKHIPRNGRGGGFLSRGKSKCILAEAFFAVNQHLYVKGGSERENLLKAFIDFLV